MYLLCVFNRGFDRNYDLNTKGCGNLSILAFINVILFC